MSKTEINGVQVVTLVVHDGNEHVSDARLYLPNELVYFMVQWPERPSHLRYLTDGDIVYKLYWNGSTCSWIKYYEVKDPDIIFHVKRKVRSLINQTFRDQ